jgi:hypothetical protein
MQVLPAAQTVGPVYPIPPHWPNLGTVPGTGPVPVDPGAPPVEVELEVGLPRPVLVAVAEKVDTLLGPVGVSPLLTHPLFAVRAAGQVTCWKVTPGLSELPNQSNRQ